MSKFEREHRYSVFKLKNLTQDQKQRLYAMQMELGPWNDVPECVVVESDWPNYQDTWADIQAVVEGRFVPRSALQAECDRLDANLASKTEIANQLKDGLAESFEKQMSLKADRDALAVKLAGVLDELCDFKSALDGMLMSGMGSEEIIEDLNKRLAHYGVGGAV